MDAPPASRDGHRHGQRQMAGRLVSTADAPMPKMRKKSDLPTKVCVACGLPFAWLRKWARDWDKVTHCSDRCRGAAKNPARAGRP